MKIATYLLLSLTLCGLTSSVQAEELPELGATRSLQVLQLIVLPDRDLESITGGRYDIDKYTSPEFIAYVKWFERQPTIVVDPLNFLRARQRQYSVTTSHASH